MADDEFGQARASTCHRMMRRGGQGQQRRFFAEAVADRDQPLGRGSDQGRCAAKQTFDISITISARHEHALAFIKPTPLRRGNDAAHRLVTWHQRIAHAWKMWHAAGPEKPLGAGADG
jgi:hypothetical protein